MEQLHIYYKYLTMMKLYDQIEYKKKKTVSTPRFIRVVGMYVSHISLS